MVVSSFSSNHCSEVVAKAVEFELVFGRPTTEVLVVESFTLETTADAFIVIPWRMGDVSSSKALDWCYFVETEY